MKGEAESHGCEAGFTISAPSGAIRPPTGFSRGRSDRGYGDTMGLGRAMILAAAAKTPEDLRDRSAIPAGEALSERQQNCSPQGPQSAAIDEHVQSGSSGPRDHSMSSASKAAAACFGMCSRMPASMIERCSSG